MPATCPHYGAFGHVYPGPSHARRPCACGTAFPVEVRTSTSYETLTYAEFMAKRDGAVRLWIDHKDRFAKLVRDGSTIARADPASASECVQLTRYGSPPTAVKWVGEVGSWGEAIAWLHQVQRDPDGPPGLLGCQNTSSHTC